LLSGEDHRLGGLRVLIVDGYADAADSLGLLLETWGVQARQAYTGPEALAVAPEYRPDVVFSEICLPGLDGCRLAQRLRAERGWVTLIALTGLGREADKVRPREAGFAHHLVKPADPGAIHRLLALAACQKRLRSSG